MESLVGWGLRASPHRPWLWTLPLVLLMTMTLGACGQSETADPAAAESAGPVGSGGDGLAFPTRIGALELEVAEYQVPEVLDAEGGAELGAMLETLGLATNEVSLVIAVDPADTLAIGRWKLPDRDAAAILAAWQGAAGSGWRSDTLGGEAALSGRGPDGSIAWAVARDDAFLYIVTHDRSLAEKAVEAIL